jgi:plasmid stabilization system protein ParE
MPYPVDVTDMAYAEIARAYAWRAERSAAAARRWQDDLFQVIDALVNDPVRHPLAPEADWYGDSLRQLLFGKRRGVYRVLFRIRGHRVQVLRVRHHAQDLLRPGDLPHELPGDDY